MCREHIVKRFRPYGLDLEADETRKVTSLLESVLEWSPCKRVKPLRPLRRMLVWEGFNVRSLTASFRMRAPQTQY
jgi:hypothetical protein